MLFKRKKKRSKYTKFSSYKRNQSRAERPKKSAINKAISSAGFRIGWRFLFYLLFLTIVGYGVYYIYFSGSMIIEETALFENDIRIDHDIIVSEINTYKGESLLNIKKTELTEELKAKYPEIEHIRVRKKLPNKLYVYIEKYPITANLIVKIAEVQRKYLINKKGVIAMSDTEDNRLPYIVMNREVAYNSKEQIFTENQLNEILKAKKLFEKKFSMQVIDILYLEDAREYHLRTEKDFYIWLDLEQDYKSQLSKLKAAEQKLNIYSTPLQYIDLRIAGNKGEKVIYKKAQ